MTTQTVKAPAGISFERVGCVFRHRSGTLVDALRDVTFTVPPGQFVAVVGRSGHGKSTLLRVLAGLTMPTSGTVYVNERPVLGPDSDRGMVFQQDTVFPWMHVRDNVEYGLRARGVDAQERERVASDWIKSVGLETFADSWPRELSGGMRKRVAFAAVLAAGAQVWLMDEPFGSLDYFNRRALHELVLEVWARTNRTVFFVTHDIEEALILADRILLMREGRIVDDLAVNLARPRTEDLRATTEAVEITKRVLEQIGTSGEEQR